MRLVMVTVVMFMVLFSILFTMNKWCTVENVKTLSHVIKTSVIATIVTSGVVFLFVEIFK